MQRIRAGLGQTSLAITFLALSAGCSSSNGESGTDVDGGGDGHDTGAAETEGGATCDKTGVCCCDGDVIEDVTCTPAGAPTCSKYTLYHGADCTRPCGPCTFSPSCFDTGVDGHADADATPADADAGGTCDPFDPSFCCCNGTDVEGMPYCTDAGTLACPGGFTPHFGADCTLSCGPCSFAPSCIDSGIDGG